MTKNQIDFEVNVALQTLISQLEKIGMELDEDSKEECRQTLEGIAIKEAAARTG